MVNNKEENNKRKNNPHLREDSRIIYSGLVEDIRFVKRQQWQVSYYCILLLAGVLSLDKYFVNSNNCDVIWWLSIVSFLIGVTGCYAICVFQFSLARYRDKKNILVGHFDPVLIEEEHILTIKINAGKFWYRGGEYVLPLCFAIVIATILVILTLRDFWQSFP